MKNFRITKEEKEYLIRRRKEKKTFKEHLDRMSKGGCTCHLREYKYCKECK